MKNYIIGYTNQEYLFAGTLVPKRVYTSEEKAKGKKDLTEVSEEDLVTLRGNKVFAALEATKKIRVLDKLPSWAISGVDREAALKARIKELEKAKGGVSTKDLEDAKAETAAVTAEAQKVIDDLRAQLAEATKAKE